MKLVVGEALVDIVERPDGSASDHVGGSPANVAVGLGRLGHEVVLATSLGDDDRGDRVRSHLTAAGVQLFPGTRVPQRTSTAVAHLTHDGAATYTFDLDWDIGPIATARPPAMLHTGSIGATLAPGADDVATLVHRLAGHSLITLDPNVRPSITPDRAEVQRRINDLVSAADVVKVSDEDLAWLEPDRPFLEVAQRWRADGPAAVIVTAGADGAHVVTAGGVAHLPSRARHVVDTVGAGDAFMAGLLQALTDLGVGPGTVRDLDAGDWRQVAGVGARAAAWVVERPGADPPWASDPW